MASGSTVVDTSQLTKRFGDFTALNAVSLTLQSGTIYGLLGPNGAGKSTLIKSMVGVIRPTAGTVRVFGQTPLHNIALRKNIGYMAQAPALYETLSCADNVAFFARAHRLEHLDQAVTTTLQAVGLEHKQKQPVYSLSGGMKQRVSLACALVHNPDLLFLDEPTAGVDPELKRELWQHFRRLARAGKTIVLSTHLMDEALLCDMLGVLYQGRLLASATPAELLQLGDGTVTIEADTTYTTPVQDYEHSLPELLQKHGLAHDVTRIAIEPASLENVVIKLIEQERA